MAFRLETWMFVRSLRSGRLGVPEAEHSWWLSLAFRTLARHGVAQLVDAMDRAVLSSNHGFSSHELMTIRRLISANLPKIVEAWK